MIHHPKGGRCSACAKRLDDCSHLPFHTMPVHWHDGADVVVICTQFVPATAERGKPFLNPRRGRRV
ncbi:hypothetical protein [Pseudomonas sp.]|uniref:hypothetical protein n=1 Tax=Pseudomonas sp. TaxID=306 RepID=UPI002730F260|nr:hypothetical protein [Pseudomonas sp.]MDP2244056.1 hypothetical protein [Pseudomonas sp.]